MRELNNLAAQVGVWGRRDRRRSCEPLRIRLRELRVGRRSLHIVYSLVLGLILRDHRSIVAQYLPVRRLNRFVMLRLLDELLRDRLLVAVLLLEQFLLV